MKVLIDLNLPAIWVPRLIAEGHDAVHWSNVGAATATDNELLAHARTRDQVILTADHDFALLLAMAQSHGPSVILLRAEAVRIDSQLGLVIAAMKKFEQELASGAMVVVEPSSARARVLPLK